MEWGLFLLLKAEVKFLRPLFDGLLPEMNGKRTSEHLRSMSADGY
jgi:hypothetical protein